MFELKGHFNELGYLWAARHTRSGTDFGGISGEKKSAGNSSAIGTAACPGKVGRNGEGPQQR
jgi:hypothetical protein